jgi:hypothetical protein
MYLDNTLDICFRSLSVTIDKPDVAISGNELRTRRARAGREVHRYFVLNSVPAQVCGGA